jgi:hypothetical protein
MFLPIIGNEPLLAGCEHHRAADKIPPYEATRLLMNRSSGLLFAWERLRRLPGCGSSHHARSSTARTNLLIPASASEILRASM